jgi:hypothetical protein
MSEHTSQTRTAPAWLRPMRARSRHEEHRASTPLELLFDAVAIPAALYLLSLWALHERPRAASLLEASLAPVTVLLILLTPFSGQPVLLIGLLLAGLLAIKLVARQRAII